MEGGSKQTHEVSLLLVSVSACFYALVVWAFNLALKVWSQLYKGDAAEVLGTQPLSWVNWLQEQM